MATIGELSAGIAHEINNFLAIIRQEAEWMQLLLKKFPDQDLKEVVELNGSMPPGLETSANQNLKIECQRADNGLSLK